jgi:putative DNA primase/helicase
MTNDDDVTEAAEAAVLAFTTRLPPLQREYLEEVTPDRNIVASCARWEPDPVSMTANDALAADAAGDSNRSAIEEAMELLRDLLSEGSVPAKEVKAEANSAGLTWATVRRAKDRLGITSKREGFGDDGVWVWELPKVHNFLKDAHV